MPDLSLPALAERLGLTSEDIQPNAGVIAYAPWDNTNTIHSEEPGVLQPRCGENRQGLHPGAGLYPLRLPFELHIFQGGEHGMSVCNNLSSYNEEARKLNEENPNVRMWVPMCVNWLNGLFGI